MEEDVKGSTVEQEPNYQDLDFAQGTQLAAEIAEQMAALQKKSLQIKKAQEAGNAKIFKALISGEGAAVIKSVYDAVVKATKPDSGIKTDHVFSGKVPGVEGTVSITLRPQMFLQHDRAVRAGKVSPLFPEPVDEPTDNGSQVEASEPDDDGLDDL
jgi:hypothetical protein